MRTLNSFRLKIVAHERIDMYFHFEHGNYRTMFKKGIMCVNWKQLANFELLYCNSHEAFLTNVIEQKGTFLERVDARGVQMYKINLSVDTPVATRTFQNDTQNSKATSAAKDPESHLEL